MTDNDQDSDYPELSQKYMQILREEMARLAKEEDDINSAKKHL